MNQQELELEEFEESLKRRGWIPWLVVLGIFVVAAGISIFLGVLQGISTAITAFFGQTVSLLLR